MGSTSENTSTPLKGKYQYKGKITRVEIPAPLDPALTYYEFNFECPYCGINVIFPRYMKPKEEEVNLRCPKCHELIKLKIEAELIYASRDVSFNPSRRY